MWVILFGTIVILIEKVKTVLSSQNDLIFYGEVFIRYIYVLIPYIFHSFVSFVKLFDFHLLVCYHANTILTVFMYYLQGNIFSPPPPFIKTVNVSQHLYMYMYSIFQWVRRCAKYSNSRNFPVEGTWSKLHCQVYKCTWFFNHA